MKERETNCTIVSGQNISLILQAYLEEGDREMVA